MAASSSSVKSDVELEPNIKEYHVDKNDLALHPSEEEFAKLAVEKHSRKAQKTEEAFARNETKKMMLADSQSESVRLADLAQAADRPPATQPKFEVGQSIHHWWAGWMNDCKEAPLQVAKKSRPKWYHGQIFSPATWMTESYGGIEYEGWHYKAY